MAMALEKSSSSKPLHNFRLPCLKWGNQRQFRCLKLDNWSRTYSSSNQRKLSSKSRTNGCVGMDYEEEGIDAVREKIMNDLKTDADKMKDEISREKVSDVEKGGTIVTAAQVESEVRRWNFGSGRAACEAPIGGPSTRKRKSSLMEEDRPKFSMNLSKKEIVEDFIELLGHRPPMRPKKRPRAVQRQLDSLFPGSWVTEVKVDSYKVPKLV